MVKHVKFRPFVKTESIHHIKKQLDPLKPFYKMYLGKNDPIEFIRKNVTKLIEKNILLIEKAKLGEENFVYRFLIKKDLMNKFYDEILPNCMNKDDGHARVFRISQTYKYGRKAFVTLNKDVDEFINQQMCISKSAYTLFNQRFI